MSSSKSTMYGKSGVGTWTQKSDFSNRYNTAAHVGMRNLRGDDNLNHFLDQEAVVVELYSRVRAQQEEILIIRQQIADSCVKELQLLNEKHKLEKKFSDLRMAVDENQKDAISSASKELAWRKADIEENLKLADHLKAAEEERYIFISSLLSLLAEYGIRPHVINASAISNSTKHLYDQLQWKIRTSHASIIDISSMLGNQPTDGSSVNVHQPAGVLNGQLFQSSTGLDCFHTYDLYRNEHYPEPTSNGDGLIHNHVSMYAEDLIRNVETHQNDNVKEFSRNDNKDVAIETTNDMYLDLHAMHDKNTSVLVEEGALSPGIEDFQIIGDAKPGSTLQACGYPVHGNSLCMFQWVRHLHNGTRTYIEGATNPDYVVTADDVDKLIAVECVPMDNRGRQGELVRLFANDQKKITCDVDMQQEIEKYISAGRATFGAQLLVDSSETWEPTTLILKRSNYQIKVNDAEVPLIAENYSSELSIKIPCGLSSQFVLTCTSGSSHPFHTENDIRMRDTLVLTMRMFQSKALDDKRKGKV